MSEPTQPIKETNCWFDMIANEWVFSYSNGKSVRVSKQTVLEVLGYEATEDFGPHISGRASIVGLRIMGQNP